jgi:PAS domain S-box-containing protein
MAGARAGSPGSNPAGSVARRRSGTPSGPDPLSQSRGPTVSLADLDIKTILTLLYVGNFIVIVVMVIYGRSAEQRSAYWHFLGGKALQGCAWILLALRGQIPDIASAYVGNTLLLYGLALEAHVLTMVGRDRGKRGIIFLSIATVGVVLFWIFATTPGLWVGYASATAVAIFVPASVYMILDLPSSPMRKAIGGFYGLICIVLAIRAWNGYFEGGSFILMSKSIVQSLSFITMFVVLIFGGIGFLLLLKEQVDKIIIKSEEKYRTLIEQASEAICIFQDESIVFNNRRLNETLGLTGVDLCGRPIGDIVYKEDLQAVLRTQEAWIDGQDFPDGYEFRMKDANGDAVWVTVSARRIEYGGRWAVLALFTNIDSRKKLEAAHEATIEELRKRIAEVKTLSGLLPICASCKKVRDDKGYWNQIEVYLSDHSSAVLSHSLCPECLGRLYPGYDDDESPAAGPAGDSGRV